MKCIEGCEGGNNNNCTRDEGCARVEAMVWHIKDSREKPPHTTTLPEVVKVAGITPDQWRADYRNEKKPSFKRAVEVELGGSIVYQQQGKVVENAVGVRRLTYIQQDS